MAATASTVWSNWSSTTASTIGAVSNPWPYWTLTASTAATVTITATSWAYWVADIGGTVTVNGTPAVRVQETAEEIRQREEYSAQQRAIWAENDRTAQEAKESANRKALLLLLAVLNEEQRKEYESHKQFHVRSRSGKRYQIRHGYQHNIHEVDEKGLRLVEYCGHVRESVPIEDHMVAQKLFLEHDEEAFIRVANRWPVHTAA